MNLDEALAVQLSMEYHSDPYRVAEIEDVDSNEIVYEHYDYKRMSNLSYCLL